METFLSDPGVPGVRSMGLGLCPSVTHRLFADLTDVTLVDEDSNLIPTIDVHRAILSNAQWGSCNGNLEIGIFHFLERSISGIFGHG